MRASDDCGHPADELTTVQRILALSARLPVLLGTTPPRADDVLARVAAQHAVTDDDAARVSGGRSGKRLWQWLFAAAAALAIGLSVTFFLARFDPALDTGFGAKSFVTGPTETVTITLQDGSVVKLAPHSRLQLESTRAERRVLLEGHGFFAVAPMKNRAFVVRTATGEIRVLGTRFDLSARGRDLQLVVVEGRVAVSASGLEAEMHAGQVGRVINGMPLPVLDVQDAQELTAWVGQFLAFQSTPLADAAREITRHYGVQIQIADPALAKRTITAWFSDWSLDDVMNVFCTVAEARCSKTNNVITVEPTQPRHPGR